MISDAYKILKQEYEYFNNYIYINRPINYPHTFPENGIDTLRWKFEDLEPFESHVIDLKMRTKSSNMLEDSIKSVVSIESEVMRY